MALNAPRDASVKTGCSQYPDGRCIGQGKVDLVWKWSPGGSGAISRFVLSYRIAGSSVWTRVYPSYPSDPNKCSSPVQCYSVEGLSGDNTTYEWTIMAEATNPSHNSTETTGEGFTTRSGGGGPPPGPPGGPALGLVRPIAAENLGELFKAIINFLFFLSLGIGPLMIIFAGLLMLTAGGNAQRITLARTIILWTLIALAIIFFAKGLTALVKGALGG